MIKLFKKLKEKIQKVRENRLKRKLKNLFPELPANNWIDRLDKSKYNIKYIMNQKTFDKVKSVISEEKLAVYNVICASDNLIRDGEVLEILSPKNPEPEVVYGELTQLRVEK